MYIIRHSSVRREPLVNAVASNIWRPTHGSFISKLWLLMQGWCWLQSPVPLSHWQPEGDFTEQLRSTCLVLGTVLSILQILSCLIFSWTPSNSRHHHPCFHSESKIECFVLDPVLRASDTLGYRFNPYKKPRDIRYYYYHPCFASKEIEVWEEEEICLK